MLLLCSAYFCFRYSCYEEHFSATSVVPRGWTYSFSLTAHCHQLEKTSIQLGCLWNTFPCECTNRIWFNHISFECSLLIIYCCVSVQSLGNSSVLKTSQLGDSPFYPGKTVYGGAAAAVRQPKLRNTAYQVGLNRRTENLKIVIIIDK